MSDKRKNPAYRYKGEIPNPLPDNPTPSLSATTKRKDTKRWCRGHQGRPHVPAAEHTLISYVTYRRDFPCADRAARLIADYSRLADPKTSERERASIRRSAWRLNGSCWHQLRCVNCGKVLTDSISILDCPDVNDRAKDTIRTLIQLLNDNNDNKENDE